MRLALEHGLPARIARPLGGPEARAPRLPRSCLVGIVAAIALATGTAHAADTGEADKLREQLRSSVLQLRECQDQRAAAKTAAACPAAPSATAPASDTAALKARLSAAQARLRAAQRDAGAAAAMKASLDKAGADYAALKASADASQAELAKFKAAFTQAADTGRAAVAERDQLKAQLATQTTIATACQAKNDRLTTFAEGLLNAYNHVSFGQRLMVKEPFTGFTKVRLENIAQDREDDIRAARCDARIDSRPPKPAAP